MPIPTIGYAVEDSSGVLQLWKFEQRDVGPNDVHIKIHACGVCGTDVHAGKNLISGFTTYPFVPGHEIVGIVASVGANVKKVKPGDKASVGIIVDCCKTCSDCKNDTEQYCKKRVMAVGGRFANGTPIYGGYARDIVIEDKFVARFPESLDMYDGASLICAGITVYSPIKHFGMDKPGKRLGVIGLGGVGHMAVKFGVAFGLHVTVISRSESKRDEALNILGAHQFLNSGNADDLVSAKKSLDIIIDTVGAPKDMNVYLSLLDTNGVLVAVAVPDKGTQLQYNPMLLVQFRRILTGSVTGSIKEIEEMLEFCAEKNITAMIEKIPMDYLNEAWERLEKSDVHYRFVVDVENTCPKI